ncbi:3-dehydroquinate synthase [Aphanothece hegewaldii CCALA 016]|uniref:3-dehydroquinate synthase n=1 Tax=Aphanothece hegewaldii CCALA 016 TaxID=2107694 RepID=A0A2T1M1E5_9CHRO|nr:3-dehydroquinate synthase [Aphanothece hegewaldii]PSF38497.1 3-dehydroquinate synthase [Aphanothece hegewaldii CCALA 016]
MTISIEQISQASLSFPTIKQQIPVTFRYNVHFTEHLFDLDNPLLAQVVAADNRLSPRGAIAIVDSGVVRHHPKLLEKIQLYADWYRDYLHLCNLPLVVTGGEVAKNEPKSVQSLHSLIDRVQLCRHSYILAIGGGAMLDMVGYAAATAHRGIRLIRIPTTVLGQNDSGIGVKNGINAFGKKNFIGTFAPPYAVINDSDFLTTLDERDWRSGVAEAIKVALIKDAEFFAYICTNVDAIVSRDKEVMRQIIYRCAQLHLDHIANSGDPFETGSSRPLDFGHWVAHRLEHLTDYRLRHGEAVAIGIALDSTYSYLARLLSYSQWQQILHTLKRLGFILFVPELINHDLNPARCLFQGLTQFREHLGGELTITVLEKIGKGIEIHEVDLTLYQQAIALLQELHRKGLVTKPLPEICT